jgi:hypothetical protein
MPDALSLCLYCNKVIRSGRSDKKFCDSGCKDAYFNDIKIAEHKEIKKIDTILKRNRRILKKLFNPKKFDKQFTREELLKAGFEFGFLTHTVVTKSKANEIVFCYDYGFREVSTGKFQLFPSFGKVKVKDGDEVKVKE